jgi:hypothetical protein
MPNPRQASSCTTSVLQGVCVCVCACACMCVLRLGGLTLPHSRPTCVLLCSVWGLTEVREPVNKTIRELLFPMSGHRSGKAQSVQDIDSDFYREVKGHANQHQETTVSQSWSWGPKVGAHFCFCFSTPHLIQIIKAWWWVDHLSRLCSARAKTKVPRTRIENHWTRYTD